MEPIRLLRSLTNLTQGAFAAQAGTSQPTIALYESGRKSPTLSTVRRLAAAVGLEPVISYVPQMTREDRRSLAYHRGVAEILRRDDTAALRRARRTLQRLRTQHLGARSLLDRWARWLRCPMPALIVHFLDPGVEAREMRQVSPFAGILRPEERVRLLRDFRRGAAL